MQFPPFPRYLVPTFLFTVYSLPALLIVCLLLPLLYLFPFPHNSSQIRFSSHSFRIQNIENHWIFCYKKFVTIFKRYFQAVCIVIGMGITSRTICIKSSVHFIAYAQRKLIQPPPPPRAKVWSLSVRNPTRMTKQDRQSTCNVTLRRFRQTNLSEIEEL